MKQQPLELPLPAPPSRPPEAPRRAPPATSPAMPREPLWLCLCFPHLSLEVVERATPDSTPLAIVDEQAGCCRIHARNRAAAAAGVQIGQKLSAAQSLLPALQTVQRAPARENRALAQLASWACQFSPSVALRPAGGLLLEVSGSLRLFRGLENLLRTVQRDLAGLGYRARRGVAPTPLGAWLLARSGDQRPALDGDALRRQLGALPVTALELPAATLTALHQLGIRRIRDCLRLPRDGLNRRLGVDVVDYLDRATGRRQDPQPLFQPPEKFSSHLLLPAEVHETRELRFAMHRLLGDLVGFLRGRDATTSRLTFRLHHLKQPATTLEVGLARPSRDPAHLKALLDNRLERLRLPAPALEVTLDADEILPFQGEKPDLFLRKRGNRLAISELVERLRARLGEEAVQQLATVADHRPERAWKTALPAAPAGERRPRPLWLLETPQPLATRSWRWRTGPERIEGGWWDGADRARDYFVADDEGGARLWLFRELRSLRWFLHGLFG
ncbi:MAG: DNA polymerase Y family protein [Gammaproteobacteria bacterium]